MWVRPTSLALRTTWSRRPPWARSGCQIHMPLPTGRAPARGGAGAAAGAGGAGRTVVVGAGAAARRGTQLPARGLHRDAGAVVGGVVGAAVGFAAQRLVSMATGLTGRPTA